jgi:hypothetical protein
MELKLDPTFSHLLVKIKVTEIEKKVEEVKDEDQEEEKYDCRLDSQKNHFMRKYFN